MADATPKPFFLSRTFAGLLVVLLAQLLERALGVTLTDAEVAEVTGIVLDLFTALGLGIAAYGRVKARQPIGSGLPVPRRDMLPLFFAPFALVLVLLGGPVGCAATAVTRSAVEGGAVTPAQALYAVTADYHAAQLAVLPLLEADVLPSAVKAEVKRLDAEAYKNLLHVRTALLAAEWAVDKPGEVDRYLAMARAAVDAFGWYIADSATPAAGKDAPR
ncbi:MAG: hypothetical protein RLY86_681 [Pseudomonadota bacterium]|jgi:hypothetical protein